MNATIENLTERRAELLRDLNAIPNALVGSQKWVDRIDELTWIKRKLVALGVEG